MTEERLLPEKDARGRFRKDAKGQFKYTKQTHTTTIPNIEYLFENNVGLDSHPADWFKLFFPKKRERQTHPKSVTMDEYTAWLNTKALNAGAGGGKYKSFKKNTSTELMAHLSLYLLHSISPRLK